MLVGGFRGRFLEGGEDPRMLSGDRGSFWGHGPSRDYWAILGLGPSSISSISNFQEQVVVIAHYVPLSYNSHDITFGLDRWLVNDGHLTHPPQHP